MEATGGSLYSSIGDGGFGSYFDGYYGSGTTFLTNSNYIIASISDDGITAELRQNGVSIRQDSDGGGFYSRSAAYIGNDGTTVQPANVYISEIIVYDRVLTTPERQQVEAYLNSKYQIY